MFNIESIYVILLSVIMMGKSYYNFVCYEDNN